MEPEVTQSDFQFMSNGSPSAFAFYEDLQEALAKLEVGERLLIEAGGRRWLVKHTEYVPGQSGCWLLVTRTRHSRHDGIPNVVGAVKGLQWKCLGFTGFTFNWRDRAGLVAATRVSARVFVPDGATQQEVGRLKPEESLLFATKNGYRILVKRPAPPEGEPEAATGWALLYLAPGGDRLVPWVFLDLNDLFAAIDEIAER